MNSICSVDMESYQAIRERNIDIMDDGTIGIWKSSSDFNAVRECILFLDTFSQQTQPTALLNNRRKPNAFFRELKHCVDLIATVDIAHQVFIYNPVVHLFIDFIALHQLDDELKVLQSAPERESLLLGHLRHLHEDLNSADLRKAIKNFKRGPDKNYKELEKYVDELFARYARLLVIRVDLAFLEAERGNVPLKDVVHYHTKLLGDRRNSPFLKDAVGYAWSLEYAEKTGYHYHLVCFYDGSKHREDMTIGLGIGEQWKAVTQGKGRVYVCNTHKNMYRLCGIGAVDYHDEIKRESLRKALAYLTKPQLFAKVGSLLKGRVRTFGRGGPPKRAPKPGRPRTKHHEGKQQKMRQERSGEGKV